MFETYRNVQFYFRFFNRKTETVNLFLHGWGCDHSSLLFCKDLSENSALFVDFPPFGKSKTPTAWSIFTYVNMVIWLLDRLKIQKVNVVGHSFGGRVGILLAVLNRERVQKLVLVDSAGVKPRRSLKFYFKIYSYKIRKKLGLDVSKSGSSDYLALNEGMRGTFKNVVNTHLDEFLSYIDAKTLVLFGENDKTTPKYMAKRLHRKIKNSQLFFLDGAGHFPFIDRRLKFSSIVEDFLKK